MQRNVPAAVRGAEIPVSRQKSGDFRPETVLYFGEKQIG